MRHFGWVASLLLAEALASGADRPGIPAPDPQEKPPAAQGPADADRVSGSYTFRNYCSTCHGPDARGDGPLAGNLRFRPADLTLLAKRNGGEFPADKVQRIVDGRRPLRGHGGPDMPVWGDAFRNAESGYDDATARERIRLVVDYLRSVQAPGK